LGAHFAAPGFQAAAGASAFCAFVTAALTADGAAAVASTSQAASGREGGGDREGVLRAASCDGAELGRLQWTTALVHAP